MDLTKLLGRYECTEGGANKFWELSFNKKTGLYEARWGAIGTKGQGPTEYPSDKAFKKVQEKLGKGYRLVSPKTPATDLTASVKKTKKSKDETEEAFDFMEELEKC